MKTAKDRISFYMLAKQFMRVADKIEYAHDMLLNQSSDIKQCKDYLDYYEKEKAILLSEMKHLLTKGEKDE